MLAGVNDSPGAGRARSRELLGRDHFKVNLIPYNPWAAGLYDGSSREQIGASGCELERRASP